MKTYIINLKTSYKRKSYMEKILSPYLGVLDIEFVEAIDGRILSEEEKYNYFDIDGFISHYNYYARPGEIGCTLSHQKCYNLLLESKYKSAIIFEDDITINYDITRIIPYLEQFLNTEEPRIILLSGWFWYSKKCRISDVLRICKVVDGYLTHAYAINRSAANLLITNRPAFLADAWEQFIHKGVKIFGLSPHPLDQDWSGVFKSEVLCNKINTHNKDIIRWLKQKKRGLFQRVLKAFNHFESPQNIDIRRIDIKKSNVR